MPGATPAWRMQTACALASLLLASAASGATPSRAKSLAQFDAGYAKCEQRFEHMRGHADQAYAGVYRLKLDAQTREQLAAARRSAEYKSAHRSAAQALAKDKSADLDQRLDQQCQALWREANR
jgi:hypothetical protein